MSGVVWFFACGILFIHGHCRACCCSFRVTVWRELKRIKGLLGSVVIS